MGNTMTATRTARVTRTTRATRTATGLLALAMVGAGCAGEARSSLAAGARPADPAAICDAEALVEAIETGAEEGTLAGMTDAPVAEAAASNPALTTLAGALDEAGLAGTLDEAPALTVFAPTDCAFAALDPGTLDAALADPSGEGARLLGLHVVPGQQLSSADLALRTEVPTLAGTTLAVAADGDVFTLGGRAEVVVPDIRTANATVHLIDQVLVP
jgi:uncharacterized surface protein with fasciclin (FAS1) repeats